MLFVNAKKIQDPKTATTAEAVFLITGMTIGAGVLGLPYAIAQVGIIPGVLYILVLGGIILLLNLLIVEIALAVGNDAQLGGLAARYLRPWVAQFFNLTIIVRDCGVLLAYLVGEGVAIQAILGGKADWWSVIFWVVMSFLVAAGLERFKTVEKIISITVISLLGGISLAVFGRFDGANFLTINWHNWLLPYGIILFALHASAAVIEAHALIPRDPARLKKAVVLGTIIPVMVYIVFSVAVVGALGSATTELASVALGAMFGPMLSAAINILAILAMSTGFMGLATAFKETLVWDEHVGNTWALLLVLGVPLLLFLLGWRGFATILGVIGGLFISVEALILVRVYWRVCQSNGLSRRKFYFFAVPIVGVFSMCLLVTILKLVA